MSIIWTQGGVCAANGFFAAGIHCGVRNNASKLDLAIIYSDRPAAAAGVFTRNQVKAAPLLLDIEKLSGGSARAIVVNSGCANACAPNGEKHAKRMCAVTADALGVSEAEVLCSSTGVIGLELNIAAVEAGIPIAAAALASDAKSSDDAANAIMTTDTVKKEFACSFKVDGHTVTLGGIAKGSGMIHPNMGTMLCYLTTDCAISAPMLRKALTTAADLSFNRVSVDGDTSTNDSCIIFANGLAGNPEINSGGSGYNAFVAALTEICVKLARAIAGDGEGASHLITCTVSGASTERCAETLARSVTGSSLTKAMIFGKDANWGRVLCALGYSGESFDSSLVNISFASAAGSIEVCKSGMGLSFDEELAKRILTEREVKILCDMGVGSAAATCWGCDLTYEYVRINGDYRT